jgi:hypothetical protein
MKVDPYRALTPSTSARRAPDGAGFTLSAPAGADVAATPAVRAAGVVATIDAVMALQGNDPDQRRRQRRRGAETLDALDQIKAGLLEGALTPERLAALKALAGGREPTGDTGLDAVLKQIDLRAQVELAKLAKGSRAQ